MNGSGADAQRKPAKFAARNLIRELEERGVVSRTVMPTTPPTVEYALTPFGLKFQPVLDAIVEVGSELQKRSVKALQERALRAS